MIVDNAFTEPPKIECVCAAEKTLGVTSEIFEKTNNEDYCIKMREGN
tara:strand:- start:2381 stop:2521 length:141 start_codon:yes stop_codon:yes gene_type:complete